MKLDGFVKANDDIQRALQDYNAGKISQFEYSRQFESAYGNNSSNYGRVAFGRGTDIIENGQPGVAYVAMPETLTWHARSPGLFDPADNPYSNGTAAKAGILRPAKARGKQGMQMYRTVGYGEPWDPVPAQTAHGASPSFSASAELPWQGRIYARYAQSYRMPSMFESIANFSKNLNYYEPVAPERGSNTEIGYVQDFHDILSNSGFSAFKNLRFADAKLVYYHNRITDVIDRDLYSNLRNFEHQTIQGIEFQSRIDTGKYFADFSAAYTLDNKVCDAAYAITLDPYYNQVSSCVKQGFFGGFLFNMAQPEYMLDLTLGTRLMGNKLELATRIHHHGGSLRDVYSSNYGDVRNMFVNIPYSWSPVTTLDFYLEYEVLKDSKLRLGITNATDAYYLDPLSRTLMPAPGRAIHIGFTTRF